MKNLTGIILAAGEGTRMKSELPKVLHPVCGRPMFKYTLDLIRAAGIKQCAVVVGYKAEKLKQALPDKHIRIIKQTKLLGSGDAVWQARNQLANFAGDLLVVYADTPLISQESIRKLVQLHRQGQAGCTLLSTSLKNPTGFGRIIRAEDGRIVKIVEEQDADTYQKAISEINVGAYCFKAKELFAALEQVKPNNAKKEYYLTDVVAILARNKAGVESVFTQDAEEAWGVNSRADLARANAVINKRNIENLINRGVTVIDPLNTYIYGQVSVGSDTIIYPYTYLEGEITIGRDCQIGPFTRLRSGTVLEDNVQIGNFVEIARTKVGTGSKIKHHSYIGDSVIGKNVNIGAGTITANYDGKKKNTTIIGDQAFIGVGTVLIAPVKIGKAAVTGAGSVLTKNTNVPAGETVVGVPAKILKKK